MPTTAMPATIAAPGPPPSEGGDSSGAVRSEYDGEGEAGAGAAAVADGVGSVTGLGDVVAVGDAGGLDSAVRDEGALDEGELACGAGSEVTCAGVLDAVALGVGAADADCSGVREGFGVFDAVADAEGEGVDDADGVGSAMTSAQPRAG